VALGDPSAFPGVRGGGGRRPGGPSGEDDGTSETRPCGAVRGP
jgi:hypothetical protein